MAEEDDNRGPAFLGEVESDLYEAALKGEATDVKFKFDGLRSKSSTLHAHSSVLMTQSDVFKVMLNERWNKGGRETKTVIPLPGDDMEDFKKFLKLLYGLRNLDCDDYELVIPAFNLADKYMATKVQTYCNEYFKVNFIDGPTSTWKAAGRVLILLKKYKNDQVYNELIEYIAWNPWDYICSCDEPRKCSTCAESGWFDWDEDIFTDILDYGSMYTGASFGQNPGRNERELLKCAVRWLEHHSKSNVLENPDGHPSPKRSRVLDQDQTARIIQKIRFRTMTSRQLIGSLQSLVVILTETQIGRMFLMYHGTSGEKLVSAYGDKNRFAMHANKRTWLVPDESSSEYDG